MSIAPKLLVDGPPIEPGSRAQFLSRWSAAAEVWQGRVLEPAWFSPALLLRSLCRCDGGTRTIVVSFAHLAGYLGRG